MIFGVCPETDRLPGLEGDKADFPAESLSVRFLNPGMLLFFKRRETRFQAL